MKVPVITVSEISRILIVLKKYWLKDKRIWNTLPQGARKELVNDIRRKLKLRSRSKKGITQ